MLRRTTLIAAALLAAGCATAPPPAQTPAPPPPVASEPESDPPLVLQPMTLRPVPVFALSAGPDLEPLPPPVGDLWERIVAGYGIPDIEGPLVEKWEQWYASRPDYVARMVDRSRRYLYHIVTEVSARRMPMEIALLPMVESAYNPVALSTARAAGRPSRRPRSLRE